MTNDYNEDDDLTVDELLEMDDEDFAEEVCADLYYTGGHESPFQDPRVIRRTMGVLIERVHYADQTLRRQAEDPNVSAERFDRTAAFRRHLISVIDITEQRMAWQEKRVTRNKGERAWKKILNEVLDHIEDSALDSLLDQMTIPFDDRPLTLRTWLQIRRVKQPSRVPEKEVAA